MAKQTWQAIRECDAVIFVVDGRSGLAPQDIEIANRLRKMQRPVTVVVNKAEGMRYSAVAADFYELGLGDPCAISAAHGDGVHDLIQEVLEKIAPPSVTDDPNMEQPNIIESTANKLEVEVEVEVKVETAPPNQTQAIESEDPSFTPSANTPFDGAIKIAIAGRANVGKSTLINTWLGEERV
ncbi:unnamed protein product, partial [Darwinula stevensoni]